MKLPIMLLLKLFGAPYVYLLILSPLSQGFKCPQSISSLSGIPNFKSYTEKVKLSFCTYITVLMFR
jgi:hypothetical protein